MKLFNPNRCPHCKAKVKTINTRHNDTHTTRRKECVQCKHRFTTAEVDHDFIKILSSKKGIEHFNAVLKLKKVRTLLNKPDISKVDIDAMLKDDIEIEEELPKQTKPKKLKVKKLPRRDPHQEFLKFAAKMEERKKEKKQNGI